MDFHLPASRDVRGAIGVTANADHAVVRDAALQLEGRLEGWRDGGRKCAQSLVDHTKVRRMKPEIGDRVEQMLKLAVQILQLAEAARQVEVLPDIAKAPLNLAFGFGPIGLAGPRMKPAMARQINLGAIRDDALRHARVGSDAFPQIGCR